MKIFITLLLSLVMIISGFFGNLFAKPEEPVVSTAQPSVTKLLYIPDKDDVELFNAVNKARRKNGVEPL